MCARLGAGLVEEQLGRQVQDRAVAARCEGQLAGLALEQRDELLGVGRRHLVGLTTSTIGVAPTTAIGVKSPGMSKGSDLSTLGKITTLFDTIDSVLPSGAERASACRPTMPPAPGWLSTTTDAPSALASAGCAARVIASTPEPVALGRMKRTVLSPGRCCAAPPARRRRGGEAAARRGLRRTSGSSVLSPWG